MSVKMRQEVERKIAEAFINSALLAGYSLSVDNGEDETEPLTDARAILAAMFLTDEEHLHAWQTSTLPQRLGKPVRVGWAYFVYGNDGWDVISDYTTNLESLMQDANAISDHYAD